MNLRQLATAVTRYLMTPFDGGRVAEPIEQAWKDYQLRWEMDPPPDPRAVFLAGVEAGRKMRDEGGQGC